MRSLDVIGIMGPVASVSVHLALAAVRLHWERLLAMLLPAASPAAKADATHKLFERPVMMQWLLGGEGTSAGVAAFLSFVGYVTGAGFRDDTVLTGQLTAGGRVMGVGGCVDKAKVALRNGRKRFVVPAENAGELQALQAKTGLEVVAVSSVWEALSAVLVQPPAATPGQRLQEGGEEGGVVLPLVRAPSPFFRAHVEVLYYQEGQVFPIEVLAVSAALSEDGREHSRGRGQLLGGPGTDPKVMRMALVVRRWILNNRKALLAQLGLPGFTLDLDCLCWGDEAQPPPDQDREERPLSVWVHVPPQSKAFIDHEGIAGVLLVALAALVTGMAPGGGTSKLAVGFGYLDHLYGAMHGIDASDLASELAQPTAVAALQGSHVRRLLLAAPPPGGDEKDGEEGAEFEDGWAQMVATAAEAQVQLLRPPTTDIIDYLRAALTPTSNNHNHHPSPPQPVPTATPPPPKRRRTVTTNGEAEGRGATAGQEQSREGQEAGGPRRAKRLSKGGHNA
jgi:hypothetical protein